MPRNQSQRMVFAFLTVLITVHAYALEILLGSPCSFRLAYRKFDPRKNHPMIFESAIINATVGIMCPAMSLVTAFLYFPYYSGFNMWTLLANWLKLVCFNFPFAFFTQMYFIQPLVRTLFKVIFAKDIKARAGEAHVERPKDKTNVRWRGRRLLWWQVRKQIYLTVPPAISNVVISHLCTRNGKGIL